MSLARAAAKRAAKQDEEEIAKQALSAIQQGPPDCIQHNGNTLAFKFHDNFYCCTISKAANVSYQDRKEIMNLLEENMRNKYESSHQGWNKREKQGELFDRSGRFISMKDRAGNLIAFVNWRFDVEECDEVDPLARLEEEVIEVLYCYEIQVKSSHRSQKLGKLLMEMLHSIAHASKVRKVMLTVFMANVQAQGFYKRLGYSIDLSSPKEEDAIKNHVDYLIMSKPAI